jgi:hypothetical protein
VVLDHLRDTYLEVWTDLADAPTLRREAEAARRLGMIGRSLSWSRSLPDEAARAEYGENVVGWLEELLED